MSDAFIKLTHMCNQFCLFCCTADDTDDLSYNDAKILVDKYIDELKYNSIVFSGGEPTLKDYLPKIIAYAKSKGAHVRLQTNGLKLSDMDYTQKLIDAGLDEVVISIHSHIPEINDEITQVKGSFIQSISAIKHLNTHKIPLTLAYVITTKNNDIINFLKYVKSNFDVKFIMFFVPWAISRGWENKSYVPILSEIESNLLEGFNFAEDNQMRFNTRGLPICYMGKFWKHSSESDLLCNNKRPLMINDYDNDRPRHSFEESNAKAECCEYCSKKDMCGGVWNTYLKIHKNDLKPFSSTKNKSIKQIKKVLFIWPFNEYYTPSYRFLLNSKIVKQEGYDVSVLYSNLLFSNNNLSLNDFLTNNPEEAFNLICDKIRSVDAELVYLGSFDNWSPHLPFIKKILNKLNNLFSDKLIILGGLYPTVESNEVIKRFPDIDLILRNDDIYSVLELIKISNNLLDIKTDLFTLNDLKKSIGDLSNLSYISSEGSIVDLKNSPVHYDYSKLPFIDYEDVLGDYKIPERIDLRSSFGCRMRCSFCNLNSFYGTNISYLSLEYFEKQLQHLKQLYSFDYIHLVDEMFLSNFDNAKKISDIIHKVDPNLKWGAMMRNEFISDSILDYLSVNGLVSVIVGLESNNVDVLKYLNKTLNPELFIKKFNSTLLSLFRYIETVEIGLIKGTPIETSKTDLELNEFVKYIKTIRKYVLAKYVDARNNKLRIALGILNIYPGSKLWTENKDNPNIKFNKKMTTEYEQFYYDNISDKLMIPKKIILK